MPVIIGETCVKHKCAFYDGLIGVCLAVGSLFGVIMGWSEVKIYFIKQGVMTIFLSLQNARTIKYNRKIISVDS